VRFEAGVRVVLRVARSFLGAGRWGWGGGGERVPTPTGGGGGGER